MGDSVELLLLPSVARSDTRIVIPPHVETMISKVGWRQNQTANSSRMQNAIDRFSRHTRFGEKETFNAVAESLGRFYDSLEINAVRFVTPPFLLLVAIDD